MDYVYLYHSGHHVTGSDLAQLKLSFLGLLIIVTFI